MEENPMDLTHYENLAELFCYPKSGFREKTKTLQIFLDKAYPEAGKLLRPFNDYYTHTSFDKLEEIYSRTFDVQAITALEVGYHLFGEDYSRGELLVQLNQEHLAANNDCGVELSDYLPNILRLIPKLKDNETLLELIGFVLLPALAKSLKDFTGKSLAVKKKVYLKHHKTLIDSSQRFGLIYEIPFRVLEFVIKSDFPNAPVITEPKTSDFIQNVATQMKIEKD